MIWISHKIPKHFVLLTLLFIALLFISTLNAQQKSRAEIDDSYKWNLTDIYPTKTDWESDKASMKTKNEMAAGYKGTLAQSGKHLYEALENIHNVYRILEKLWIYAELSSDQDTREAEPMMMLEEMNKVWNEYGTTLSFLEPELLAIPGEKMESFFKEESRLQTYKQYLDNIQRMKPHTLNPAEEEIVTKTGLISGIAQSINNIFNNADMPYPTVTLTDGNEVRLDVPGYARHRYSKNRDDRIIVFNAFFGKLGEFRRTYATMLNGNLKENLFYKDVRKYNTILEMMLFGKNVPTSVYTNLIKNVHEYLPTLHRYLKIRKRMLGVAELHYYDFYPDLVEGVDIQFTYEEAQKILKKALKPLGKEYQRQLDKSFSDRWIDVYPSTGKASGAYCNCGYDTHPYVKVNYNNRFSDMSMLAHELGHALHSYYSNKNQPYINSNYSSFVAEIAATTNECLVADYIIRKMKDKKKKLSLLGNWVEAYRQTLFRQTKFAEFEMITNEMSERGESLSADKYDELYLNLLKKYYGHEEGVSVIDDIFAHEWCYISHWYLGFYHFQYSTSYTASIALLQMMSNGGKKEVLKYINFLSSGCSEYPIPMLQKLGIDMTSDKPFELAMAKMNELLDEMEKLLDE